MQRTVAYYKQVEEKMVAAGKDLFAKKFSLEIDEMGLPPIEDFARAAQDLRNPDIEAKFMVLRWAILKRNVKVFYDGQLYCDFQMNNINDDLEVVDKRLKGPAILFLLEQAWYNLLEKCLPPLTGDQATARRTPASPASLRKR